MKPQQAFITVEQHTFVPCLTAESNVIDLGGNKGHFSTTISKLFGCNLTTVEPTPDLYAKLVDRHLPRTRVIHAAACGQDGQLTFHIDPRDSESSSIFKTGDVNKPTLSVQGLSLESIIKQSGFERVDLLKVDIEGAEVQLLANARAELLAGINQIVIEFHDFNGIITLGDVASTVQRLRHEGFFCMKFSRSNHDWLAIRPDRVGWNPLMPMLAHLWHRPKHLLRYKLSGRYNTHN